MRVCIAGDSGLLGQALVWRGAGIEEHEVLGFSRSSFGGNPYWGKWLSKYQHVRYDFTGNDLGTFRKLITEFQPDLLINCIGCPDVQWCEENPAESDRLNAEIPGLIAQVTRELSIRLIHVSTDHVFDGKKGEPYGEDDSPNPINCYGKSKLQGERRVLHNNGDALAVRTNFVGFRDRLKQPTFAEWLCNALWMRESISLFVDYVTSSIHVDELAALLYLAAETKLSGLLNIATQAAVSKYRFAELLAQELDIDLSFGKKCSLASSHLQTARPPYLALDVSRGEKVLSAVFPQAEDTVRKIATDFKTRLWKEK